MVREYFEQARAEVDEMIAKGATPEAIHNYIAEKMIGGALELLPYIDWEAHDEFWDGFYVPLHRGPIEEETRYTR